MHRNCLLDGLTKESRLRVVAPDETAVPNPLVMRFQGALGLFDFMILAGSLDSRLSPA